METKTFKFNFLPSTGNNGTVVDLRNDIEVCQLKDIFLLNARLKPEGKIIIGEEVPMPLFWRQYAGHEDTEKNAGIMISQKVVYESKKIVFNILSTNPSKSILSNYILDIGYSEKFKSYVYNFKSILHINQGCEWIVSPNIAHGEVEFCNFYPNGVFTKKSNEVKKYFSCFYENENGNILNLPHTHLDLGIYQNLPLKEGARFYYMLEDENPVIEILNTSHNKICYAGICSYMWDVHFGFKVCNKDQDIVLKENDDFESSFRIFSVSRDFGEDILKRAKKANLNEIINIPMYHKGLNTFSNNLSDYENIHNIWPWQKEIHLSQKTLNHDPVKFRLDSRIGYNDNNSLYINLKEQGLARWIFTSLGPEFGGDEFVLNKKYILKAMVRSENLKDQSFIRLGFRIHYKDEGDVFNLVNYKYYFSEKVTQIINDPDSEWQECICETPVISKIPDRVHLLLELNGEGECWFDDVIFEME